VAAGHHAGSLFGRSTGVTGTLSTNPRRLSRPVGCELEGWPVARHGDFGVSFRIRDDERAPLFCRIERWADVSR
jgi:hypothetical protein